MKFTQDQIQQLLLEKIAGTIEANDDMALEQLLREDEYVLQQWRTMQHQLQSAALQGFSIHTDVEENWQQLSPLLNQPAGSHIRITRMGRIALVAAFAAAIFFGFYILLNTGNAPDAAALSASEKKASIYLVMDNGEKLFLKLQGDNRYTFGHIKIRANNKELSYVPQSDGQQQWTTLGVPRILTYKIRLSDGSEVWLNAQSTLRFPSAFNGSTREVFVEGEAYFKVAKNPAKPFIVHAGQTSVRVLGTQFNINTYDPGKVKTSLVEGSVADSCNHQAIRLTPGLAATFSRASRSFSVATFDQTQELSWMKGIYFFRNSSLRELSGLLTRWYDVQVKFENDALADKTFTGEIVKDQPIERFLENISMSNALHVNKVNGIVYIKK